MYVQWKSVLVVFSSLVVTASAVSGTIAGTSQGYKHLSTFDFKLGGRMELSVQSVDVKFQSEHDQEHLAYPKMAFALLRIHEEVDRTEFDNQNMCLEKHIKDVPDMDFRLRRLQQSNGKPGEWLQPLHFEYDIDLVEGIYDLYFFVCEDVSWYRVSYELLQQNPGPLYVSSGDEWTTVSSTFGVGAFGCLLVYWISAMQNKSDANLRKHSESGTPNGEDGLLVGYASNIPSGANSELPPRDRASKMVFRTLMLIIVCKILHTAAESHLQHKLKFEGDASGEYLTSWVANVADISIAVLTWMAAWYWTKILAERSHAPTKIFRALVVFTLQLVFNLSFHVVRTHDWNAEYLELSSVFSTSTLAPIVWVTMSNMAMSFCVVKMLYDGVSTGDEICVRGTCYFYLTIVTYLMLSFWWQHATFNPYSLWVERFTSTGASVAYYSVLSTQLLSLQKLFSRTAAHSESSIS